MNGLKKTWDENVTKLEEGFLAFPWDNERAYAAYLAQTFYYVTHSVKLLEYAANVADPELKECLLHHVEEENGHEKLALNDLEKLGYSLEDFPESPESKEMYEAIYKGIDDHGPAPIIGYAMALEGLSARQCPRVAEILIDKYGRNKSTFIKLHGDVDPGHMEDSFEVLKFFNEDDYRIIERFIVESSERYLSFLGLVGKLAVAKAS